MDRRHFVKKIGLSSLSLGTVTFLGHGCSSGSNSSTSSAGSILFPRQDDQLILAEGLEYEMLIKELDPINDQMSFGADNAGIVFLPESEHEGYLWINHETVNPVLASGFDETKARHRDMILTEMYRVGGTILKIRKESGKWNPVRDDIDNYRVTGASKVPLNWDQPIEGFNSVVGTVANRGACKTPWGTILSGERNYSKFYGEYDFDNDQRSAGELEWQSFYPKHHPHHYGWIIEVDPSTGSARKHVGMGRMFHGDVAMKELADGNVAVYTTDDRSGGCLYKYVATTEDFGAGRLFVANFDDGTWELLEISRHELAEIFTDHTELLIRTGKGASQVGGTALDSPSGLAIDPDSGDLILTLRGVKSKGAILRVKELVEDRVAMEEIVKGGNDEGFAHPTASAVGPDGRFWFASSISPKNIGKGDYEGFGNNGLFVMNLSNPDSPAQMASAPIDAEFGGLHFSPDGQTLFLSVQHPGARTQTLKELTSNWPGGGTTVPLSAVVSVSGPALNSKIST